MEESDNSNLNQLVSVESISQSPNSVLINFFSLQVLPERTHPEVMMSGGGGYLLSGLVVDNTGVEGCDGPIVEKNSGIKKQRIN